jgi:twitching motility protein PilT
MLIDSGVVSESDLERCLAIQALTGATRPIGQILVEQGLVDSATLQRVLDLQRQKKQQRQRKVAPAADVGASDALRNSLLQAAKKNGASEMVVSEGRMVRIRVGGEWRDITSEAVTGPEVWDFVREAIGSDVLEQLADRQFVIRSWRDKAHGHGTAMAFRHFEGVAARLTFAPSELQKPESIGLPSQVLEAVRGTRGLVLLTGERGAGRSEAMAHLVKVAGNDAAQYVIVLDDEPSALPPPDAMVAHRRFGLSPADRAAAVRSAVREDPDVLVISDVGDPAIFELALRAADGGRLVIAYLDAPSVVAALNRIVDFYPVYDVPRVRATLAGALRMILVRHQLPAANREGTVVASEMLCVDDAVREALRHGDIADIGLLLRMEGARCGHSLDRNLMDLFAAGHVHIEDVFARADEKAWVLERTRNLQTAKG